MKSVRRDEVARLYGVLGSVKDTLSKSIKNNLCLTIKIVLLDVMLNNMNKTFGRKPDKETFWLLLWIWTKVTRSAERKKA